MIKVFLDTNVFLDLLLERGTLADASETILTWCEEGQIIGVTSSVSIANIYYVVRKHRSSKAEAKKVVRKILGFIGISAITKKDLLLSIESDFNDFEDAIQYYSALNIDDLNFILTKNVKDYTQSTIPIITPENFVSMFE